MGVRPMKINVIAISLVVLSGCSVTNILQTQDGFCRSLYADFPARFEEDIARELRKHPPNGALTKSYSRALWNEYWNNRIFYVWSIGPESCGGTYRGPSGSDLIRSALTSRQNAGLPPIELEERNAGKQL